MSIVINMAKAKDIQRGLIRKDRDSLLSVLDIEALKCLNDQAALDQIDVKKQALRDAPASHLIDNATTVEDLKALTIETIINGGVK